MKYLIAAAIALFVMGCGTDDQECRNQYVWGPAGQSTYTVCE